MVRPRRMSAISARTSTNWRSTSPACWHRKQAWAGYPSRTPSSAKARSLLAWSSQRRASTVGFGFMRHDPFGKDLLDERAPLRPHALELLRRIDEEIEP